MGTWKEIERPKSITAEETRGILSECRLCHGWLCASLLALDGAQSARVPLRERRYVPAIHLL